MPNLLFVAVRTTTAPRRIRQITTRLITADATEEYTTHFPTPSPLQQLIDQLHRTDYIIGLHIDRTLNLLTTELHRTGQTQIPHLLRPQIWNPPEHHIPRICLHRLLLQHRTTATCPNLEASRSSAAGTFERHLQPLHTELNYCQNTYTTLQKFQHTHQIHYPEDIIDLS